jgi:hypothetical protein
VRQSNASATMGIYSNQWETLRAQCAKLIEYDERQQALLPTLPSITQAYFERAELALSVARETASLLLSCPEWPFTENWQAYAQPWTNYYQATLDVLVIDERTQEEQVRQRLEKINDPTVATFAIEKLQPILAFALSKKNQEEVKQFSETFAGNYENLIIDAEKAKKQIEELLTQSRDAYDSQLQISGNASALEFVVDFNSQASNHRSARQFAFVVVVALAILMLGSFALGVYYTYDPSISDHRKALGDAFTSLIPFTPVFALFITLILLSIKVYINESHLYVVNRQKELAARTFKSFASQAEGDVRAAILQHTVASIFTLSATGYSKEQPEIPISPLSSFIKIRE